MSKSRNSKYATAFAAALDEQLSAKRMRQADLARATGRSPSYLNHTIMGRKTVSPEWANTIAQALGCSVQEKRELHRAAAKDAGFDIDK